MNPERLREIKWSVAYLDITPRRRCRCGGSCDRCMEYARHERNVSMGVVEELVKALENAQRAKESEE